VGWTEVSAATNNGGIWRSVNPTADVNGIYPPAFNKVQAGLFTGDAVAYIAFASGPPVLFAKNSTAAGTANYGMQLVAMIDTLGVSPSLLAPTDKAVGEGVALSTTDLTLTEILTWKAMPGATDYEVQIGNDADFASLVSFTGLALPIRTTGQEFKAYGMVPGKTYYWRIRADRATDANAPYLSPWSEGRQFTIGSSALGGEVKFSVISPDIGATNVSTTPIYQWTEYTGAINYELQVSRFSDFSVLEYTTNVTGLFYKADKGLVNNTTFYWRVRGVTGPGTAGPWASGVFVTAPAPTTPQPPVITVPASPQPPQIIQVPVPTPQPIPSYLLWIIIVIGAILIIALIVLIVRTRRVT
jgi:hypothetical protein